MSKKNPQLPFSKRLIVVCILALVCPVQVYAQHESTNTQQLRKQIEALEKIEKDPATGEEVRNLNRTILADRRSQLATHLTKEIEGLEKYSLTIAASLSESEKQKIADRVTSLRNEVNALSQKDFAVGTDPANLTADRTPENSATAVPTNLGTLGTSANDSSSNHPSPRSVESNVGPLAVATCFPDAPTDLIKTATAAAERFVQNRNPSSQFGDLVYFAVIHTVAVDAGRQDLLKAIEIKQLQEQTKRTDKQIGAPASSAGSTSAAEKPGLAEILGFAVEHGAIQQAVNGTTLNLSTTPYAFTTFSGGDTQSNYKKNGYLTRLGISADFNIENQDALLTNARRSQLADWGLRLRLSKDRSTRSDDVEEIWNSISSQFAQPSLVITDMLRATFQGDIELETERRAVLERLSAMLAESSVNAIKNDTALSQSQKTDQIAVQILCRTKSEIVDRIRTGGFNISKDSRDRIVRVTLPAYALAIKAKEEALKDFDARVEALSLKPIFTLAYNDVRPASGTNYSELKMLYQKKTGDPISLVANAGISLYHNPNTAIKQNTVRDFSVALAFEGQAGRSPFLTEAQDESQITYSFTGRYERLLANRLIAGRKADIAVAQFKVNVPMFSGMSFPFSVSYANATELVKESHVRANFGFSFDADKLLKAIALSKLSSF
jgi:hypothetical protein